MSTKNRKPKTISQIIALDQSVGSPTNAIATDDLTGLPLVVEVLAAFEVDNLLCSEFAISPSTAKRWRLLDPSFPKPCTPKVARPLWRRVDVLRWIESYLVNGSDQTK
jgi:hypothetical protein